MIRVVETPGAPISWEGLNLWEKPAKHGELIEPAKQVAEFAQAHPFEWVQRDLLPVKYAKRILQGRSQQFHLEGRWVVSTRGGLFHVKYIGILGELCFNGPPR